MGSANIGQVVLRGTGKVAECESAEQPVSGVPLWSFLQFLPSGSYPEFMP